MNFLTPHQSQYFAWQLTRQAASDSVESLASALVDSQVDLNPHQVEAALFACRNPLSRGVILADEVGLGKTIEAGLVISQNWAERRRKMLIIVPANLRKQWHQELQDKFNLQGLILEAKNYNAMRKEGVTQPFQHAGGPVICSYQFAKAKADDLKRIHWDLVVTDEAHRLRNVYKNGNVIARTIRDALEHVDAKVLLTATPLQNINLQFCSLVINYDLPWNPQRIEQRIGRCHRYGQKHDVVVVNFVDRSNEADARHFTGTLTWRDESTEARPLNELPSEEKPELVRYIPQGYFEELCNEHVSGKSNAFEKELRAVTGPLRMGP